jgi:nicotinamide mononucleotide transporter
MSLIELIAAALGLVSVWLTVRQNIWCFPIGIVMVTLYAYVFYDAKLYSDMLLQIIYVVLQVWGWYQWKKGDEQQNLPITWLNNGQRLLALATVLLATAALGTFMFRQTDAAFPYIDASLTATSLVAQGLMTYKKIENWVLWIIADIVYVFVYWQRDLPITAVLYAIFLVMASVGLYEWIRERRRITVLSNNSQR